MIFVTIRDAVQPGAPQPAGDITSEKLLFRRLTVAFGLLAAATSVIGILTARYGIILISSGLPENKTIATQCSPGMVLPWVSPRLRGHSPGSALDKTGNSGNPYCYCVHRAYRICIQRTRKPFFHREFFYKSWNCYHRAVVVTDLPGRRRPARSCRTYCGLYFPTCGPVRWTAMGKGRDQYSGAGNFPYQSHLCPELCIQRPPPVRDSS